MMSKLALKVLGVNLLILIIYSFLAKGEYGGLDGALAFMFFMMFVVAGHFGICLLIGILYGVKGKKTEANAFYLSALFVALVGFSTCAGLVN